MFPRYVGRRWANIIWVVSQLATVEFQHSALPSDLSGLVREIIGREEKQLLY